MLSKENSYDVYTFEKDNKAYFEKTLPPRHNDYYTLNSFNNIINNLLLEQKIKMFLCISLEILMVLWLEELI